MNPPNGQTPIDYLNQIAPQTPKKPAFELNLRTIIFGAIILIILVIIMVSITSALGNSSKEPWQRLSARLAATAVLAESATREIKSGQLRSINSNLKLSIANTQRDLTEPFANLDITTESIPDSIAAEENGEATLARLEDGRLNAKYDTTYSREMGYQLTTLLALINQVYSSSGSAANKERLLTAYNNLKPIQESINNFTTANE